jgi:hypothetical protein
LMREHVAQVGQAVVEYVRQRDQTVNHDA